MKVLEVARVVAAGVVAGCAVLAAPGTARALSCGVLPLLQKPQNGDTGVPTNTLIWAHGRFGGSAARLVGPDGEVPLEERFFPVAISPGAGTNYPILSPLEPLRPQARYSIEFDFHDGVYEKEGTARTSFTTGDGPLLGRPPIPELLSSVPVGGRGWEGLTQQMLELEFAAEGILIADNAGALGDVRHARDLFQPEGASYAGLMLSERFRVVRWLSSEPRLSVGIGDCLIWPDWGQLRAEARFGVLDLAGNFSGWTEVTELVLPSEQEALALIEEAEARAAEAASAPAPGLREDHDAGCSLRAAAQGSRNDARWILALLGAGLLWRARTRKAAR